MKRVTLYVLAFAMSALGFACLTGCDLLEETVCEGVLLEDASPEQLAGALLDLGLEDLGGLFGDDD